MKLLTKKEIQEGSSKELEKNVRELSEIQKEISERRKELNSINVEYEKKKVMEEFGLFVKDIDNKKAKLLEDIVLIEKRKDKMDVPVKDIELLMIEKSKELDEIQRKITDRKSYIDGIFGREAELLVKESFISARESEVHIREQEIIKERGEIQKDRVHLQSQQMTLRSSFEELKRLKNI